MPSSSAHLAAAAEAAPLRRRRPCQPVALPLSASRYLQLPSRDWAALPPELISSVFHLLDPVQIMLGADKVCRSWRRAARDEPELWRRIDMRGHKQLANRNMADLDQMAVDAVLRSQGQCQAFMGDRASVNDDFLRFLAVQAPSLKSLILISCREKVSDQGFLVAIQMFPQLEELELSECWNVRNKWLFEVVSKSCPHLKHLRHSRTVYTQCTCCPKPAGDDTEAMGIATMHEVCFLQLVNNNLTNQGLAAILGNCSHLESLEIRECRNIIIDDALQAMCARIKSLKLVPSDPISHDRVDFEPSPISECSTCLNYFVKDTRERYPNRPEMTTDSNVEHKAVATVRELRSLELYHNDLTSQRLAAILKKFPHLESSDIYNCRNIIMNNAIHVSKLGVKYPYNRMADEIKTMKLTMELLRVKFDSNNSYVGLTLNFPEINRSYAFGSKNTHRILRKRMTKYNHKASKPVEGNFFCKEFDHEERGPRMPILECSTCLMFEYFTKSWEESDLDDSCYYDPSYGLGESDLDNSYYGLDSHDQIDFQMNDLMVCKRLRRYLKNGMKL